MRRSRPAPGASPRGRWRAASEPVTDDRGAGLALERAREAVFHLRPVERRLLELLLFRRKRLDFQHHEAVAGRRLWHRVVKAALELRDARERGDTGEAAAARDGR